MRSRMFIGSALVVAVLAVSAFASSGSGVAAARQWAIVYLSTPTVIAGNFAAGTVMFVHDEAKMAAGRPCTEVYQFEERKGPTTLIAAFHCIPKTREVAERFTLGTHESRDGNTRLIEYQFAGDREGHGVPASKTPLPEKKHACGGCCDCCR